MTRTSFLPVALSIVAGVTDVTSWLLLGGFFSAHITGNFVVLTADIVGGGRPGITAVLAIPAFLVTTVLATTIARSLAARRRATTTALLGAQAVLLFAAAGLSFGTHASADPGRPMAVVIAMCAVCAMATQNAYLHLVPSRAPSTAVMTGNLVAATVALSDVVRTRGRDESAREAWLRSGPLLVGFSIGCLLGAICAQRLGDQASLLPAALAALLVVVVVVAGPQGDIRTGFATSGSSSAGSTHTNPNLTSPAVDHRHEEASPDL